MAEKESKKRKRQSNFDAASNKRSALEDPSSGQIRVEVLNDGGIQPILLSSLGLITPHIAFQAYSKAAPAEYSYSISSGSVQNELLLHSSEHPRIDYTAAQTSLDQHLSHYVAVYDAAASQLRIIPSHHLTLRSALRSRPNDEAEDTKRTIGQQRAELGQQFGTKKAKKVIADRTVNAIVDAVPEKSKHKAQDVILDSMGESALPALNEQEALEAELASKPIPKPDVQATEPKDIYPFDTLIPPDHATLISVKEWQDTVRAGQGINFNHRYPAYRVSRLAKSDEILRLEALRYLTLLLEFNSALQAAGKTGKKVPQKDKLSQTLSTYPQALVDKVRIRFSNEKNELPKWHLEKLYTHICALSLYIDLYTTDTSHLRDDLKMENRDIMRYFRELGCKVAPPLERERESVNQWFGREAMTKGLAGTVRIAKLKVPPDFPKAKKGRRT